MSRRQWGGRRAQKIRAQFRPLIEACEVVCHFCGRMILPGQRWDVDHLEAHANGGAEWDLANLRPAHASCNRREGQKLAMRNRPRRPKRRRPPRPRVY